MNRWRVYRSPHGYWRAEDTACPTLGLTPWKWNDCRCGAFTSWRAALNHAMRGGRP